MQENEVNNWQQCEEWGCPYFICTWGSEMYCYVHEENIVGKAEMDRRYDLTHEYPLGLMTHIHTNYVTKSFKEIKNKNMNKNTAFQITLKGWLAIRVIKCKTLDEFSVLWDDLTEEVRLRAIKNGLPDGVPALILNGKGYAITLIEGKK